MRPGTRVLTPATGESFTFDAGSFALELLLTGGPGMYERWEILHEPADLARWLVGSRLDAAEFRIRADEFHRVKQFRDTFLQVSLALSRGDVPAAADLEVVNYAAGRQPIPRIDPSTLTRTLVTPVTGTQVLGAAASDAIDLVAAAEGRRLRMCAGDNCYLLFLDTSRPGNRRWCSMQRCGNRNKISTFRAKGT